MSYSYFSQECPTCGRSLQIRVEHLGKEVSCQHCHGQLTACDPANARADDLHSTDLLLRRAEELLESVDERRGAVSYPR